MSIAALNFSAYQHSIAAAYVPPRPASVPPTTPTAAQPQDTPTVSLLGNLLTWLAAGNVTASRQSLDALTQASGAVQIDDQPDITGEFPRLLTRILGFLDTGDTTPALAQIQQSLLASGRTTGTAFSATA